MPAAAAPRLLPPPDELRLTLREDPQSTLPLRPSCQGQAAQTLTCRAFVLTLENASAHTIHIAGTCQPSIVVEERRPGYGWLGIGGAVSACPTREWTNTAIPPGHRVEFATRPIYPPPYDAVAPGLHTVRAKWILEGCTDLTEGADCLAPLLIVHPPDTLPPVVVQEPVTAISNEVTVTSPEIQETGPLEFSIEVAVSSGPPPNGVAGCDSNQLPTIDCVVFHYVIRNRGSIAARYTTLSCSHSGIGPEYKIEDSGWKPVPQRQWICLRNVTIQTPLPPGALVEGDFTLSSLVPGYDPALLRNAGEHRLRFWFNPSACAASPDGSFCLTEVTRRQPVVSPEVVVRTK